MKKKGLTHVGDDNRARMVDVSGKGETVRSASAEAEVHLGREVAKMLAEDGSVKKGNVLETARIAGIQAAKKTADLIPMCHPLALDHVDVAGELDGDLLRLTCDVRCTGKTGVEMEAMTGVTVAAITVYDMCKSAARGIEIGKVRLLRKTGGKSGTWSRNGSVDAKGTAEVLAVCISPGGVPKNPVQEAKVTKTGLEGDGRDHEKHWKDERAVSIQDEELLETLCGEGYDLGHGTMGENLTVRNLDVQGKEPGTRLHFSGGVELELTEARRPCFVLDKIDPKLKDDVILRCGYMARVIQDGTIRPGEKIRVVAAAPGEAEVDG